MDDLSFLFPCPPILLATTEHRALPNTVIYPCININRVSPMGQGGCPFSEL